MVVKQLRSGSRVLAVLEAVAFQQPVGLSELVRALGLEKSGVHRALTTLATEGWIRAGCRHGRDEMGADNPHARCCPRG